MGPKNEVVDFMIVKMLRTDPDLKPEVALSWSINAKNTLSNHSLAHCFRSESQSINQGGFRDQKKTEIKRVPSEKMITD